MTPTPRTVLGAAAFTGIGVLLTACGSGGGSAAAPAPPAPAAASSAATSPGPATAAQPTATGAPPSAPSQAAPTPFATESNPPGDIPDNQVYVRYTPPGARFSVKIPEGWARSVTGSTVTFTDKLNSIRITTTGAATAPTPATARSSELPTIAAQAPTFSLDKVSTVSRPAGPAVLITYTRDSAPDPVTNKVVRQAVERYEFWRAGTEVVLSLAGPVGADNVDPWRTVTDSLRWK